MSLFSNFTRFASFPDYFGQNWDAFSDTLRDLSWVDAHTVLIAHEDVPLAANTQDLLVYLDILAAAVEFWTGLEEHELLVAFPQEAELTIARLKSK